MISLFVIPKHISFEVKIKKPNIISPSNHQRPSPKALTCHHRKTFEVKINPNLEGLHLMKFSISLTPHTYSPFSCMLYSYCLSSAEASAFHSHISSAMMAPASTVFEHVLGDLDLINALILKVKPRMNLLIDGFLECELYVLNFRFYECLSF
ncbi:hypothetical protein HanHA300_Chr12g0440311 [Helianthus annuus]|nr:hypothetical protein HanHA300_Chr12g0440311 [Helianthus annuus]KAJ0504994.1 hypothetical protein HanHA89_Chr12g0465421 [Helianthus annuus]KAJ0674677.1 hypothetical protein HanLR1_Chr12g0442541 [Helianthus annuus]